ncbi:MAG: hypothetical protein CMM84_11425 [Rhodothermaceae bacterium]|nr:hypothetical protein [Rhodothermaceae bacterium]
MTDASARAASARPVPTAPVDGAVAPLDAVVFRWTAPPGTRVFDLRVATAAAPSDTLFEVTGLPSTEATLAGALPAGDLLWWVRQEGGAWSAPARFHAGTQADVEIAHRAEAEAAARRRASERAAQASDIPDAPPPAPVWPYATGDALDGAPEVDWARVPGFGAPARAALPRADAAAPTLLGPLGGEVADAGTVALRWTGVPGADRYEVELSPRTRFDADVLTLDAGGATELVLPGVVPAAGHKMLWRVRAHVGRGATAWSRYGRFYPADADTAERFSLAMDRALTAQRLQRDHARRVQQREMDLIPLHERPDAVTSQAMVTAILAMVVSSGLLIALAAVFAAVWL